MRNTQRSMATCSTTEGALLQNIGSTTNYIAVMEASSQADAVHGHSLNYLLRPIRFLRATSSSKVEEGPCLSDTATERHAVGGRDQLAAGLEARTFYETLISTPSPSGDTKRTLSAGRGDARRRRDSKAARRTRKTATEPPGPRKEARSERLRARTLSAFLRSAQEGDVGAMSSHLESGAVDVDSADSFDWTALMCASQSGRSDAVSFLLGRGATWGRHRDKAGRTALDLAKLAGHGAVVELLEAESRESPPNPGKLPQRGEVRPKDERFWCDVCEVEVNESTRGAHRSCTVHLFSRQLGPPATLYGIPESNMGFRMMLRDGWDKERGLGPAGAGLKFPVKTVLKRDRTGLGAAPRDRETARARVTHFGPYDAAAVKRPSPTGDVSSPRTATLDKRARRKTATKEKNWERNYRQSFNIDL